MHILPRFAGEGDRPIGRWVGASEQTTVRAPKKTIKNARQLRRALSPPEARLWSRLRERVPGKPIFRRRHPIGPYVLDFYCAKANLAVEIDGISHDMADRPERDIRRDAWLKKNGVTVMRIPAAELLSGIDEVADAIVQAATEMR
jgi:very-short-patch-repair endonuclease